MKNVSGIVNENETNNIVKNKSANPNTLYLGKNANDATTFIVLKNNISKEKIIAANNGDLKIKSKSALNKS